MFAKRLIIASNNTHKICELKAMLAPHFDEILSMAEAGLSLDIEETGSTFRENAVIKAEAVASLVKGPALADDSGLEVWALHGAPGVYSARFAGMHGDDQANNQKLLEEMQELAGDKRQAQYKACIAIAMPGFPVLTAEGTCPGVILCEPQGTSGFGYDPLFFLPSLGCTMAQLSPEIKNSISHRHHAMEGIKQLLANLPSQI